MRRLAMAMAIVALVWPAGSAPTACWAGDSDQRVANLLAQNLQASDVLKGFKIQVKYREGAARLEGWVRNQQQADEAVAIANRTPEVEQVISQLEIKADAAAPALIMPASAVKPQRLPPAPETASSPSGPDQPVLRSALRSQRSGTTQPAEFKPSAPIGSQRPPHELMVGQRLPQPSVPRTLASVSPRNLPAQSGSRLDRPAPMPAPEQPPAVAPRAVPIEPKSVERPSAPRPKPTNAAQPTNTAQAGGWGRSGAPTVSQAPSMPRRPQPAPMPAIHPQQHGYPQQAYYPQPHAQGYPMQYPTAAYQQPAPMGNPMPVPTHVPGVGGGVAPAMYDQPNLPNYAWPTYAPYPNYAALTYPKQYSPTAWPYIGPFYPYPQVPLGWRKVTLEWDDGWWFLDFSDDRRHGCGR